MSKNATVLKLSLTKCEKGKKINEAHDFPLCRRTSEMPGVQLGRMQ